MRSMRLYIVAAAIAGLACSGDDGPSEPGDTNNTSPTVTVTNNQFNPSALSVPVNSTVTWQWNSGGVAHNVTFQDGTASASLTSGSFPRMFTAAGSFPYMCTLHPGMAGSVSVTASTGGGGGDTGGDGGGGDYP
jgi:plastocyanin